jgi:hypothetical protein
MGTEKFNATGTAHLTNGSPCLFRPSFFSRGALSSHAGLPRYFGVELDGPVLFDGAWLAGVGWPALEFRHIAHTSGMHAFRPRSGRLLTYSVIV